MEFQLSDRQKLMLKGKICPYCGADTEFVDSSFIYGASYGMIYICKPCDAYCGVHKGTANALGRIANGDLRFWKKEAHATFDPIWQNKIMGRSKAYKWLSGQLQIPIEYTHIGMFTIQTCRKVIELSKEFLNG